MNVAGGHGRPRQYTFAGIDGGQISATEVSLREVDIRQVGPVEIGFAEVGFPQSSAAHFGSGQVGPLQISLG